MGFLASALSIWNGVPSWVRSIVLYAVVALGAVGGYAAWSAHKVAEGRAEQRQIDKQEAADDAAKLAVKVAAAEKAREQELSDLRAYRAAHPVGTVQLCRTPTVVRPAIHEASTPTANLLYVPAPDLGGGSGGAGPDIGPMLDALAVAADKVNADLRKEQTK